MAIPPDRNSHTKHDRTGKGKGKRRRRRIHHRGTEDTEEDKRR
jgi:hypothetical protein